MASSNRNQGFFRVKEPEKEPMVRTPDAIIPWEFGNLFKEPLLLRPTATGMNTNEQTPRHPRHPHHDNQRLALDEWLHRTRQDHHTGNAPDNP